MALFHQIRPFSDLVVTKAGPRLAKAAQEAAEIARRERKAARVTENGITVTPSISVTPKKRGRPKADGALSGAEKQRAYRQRKRGAG